jgi:hypothetical protein
MGLVREMIIFSPFMGWTILFFAALSDTEVTNLSRLTVEFECKVIAGIAGVEGENGHNLLLSELCPS